MENTLNHETWVSTATTQTFLVHTLDISAERANVVCSWERLLKRELLRWVAGAGLEQLGSFPPGRSGQLTGTAAVPLWPRSPVVSPLDQHATVRYALATAV